MALGEALQNRKLATNYVAFTFGGRATLADYHIEIDAMACSKFKSTCRLTFSVTR